MPEPTGSRPSDRRAVREIVQFGAAGGVLLAVLKLTEYRFLVPRGVLRRPLVS